MIFTTILLMFILNTSCSMFLSSEPLYQKSRHYEINLPKIWDKIDIPEVDQAWKLKNGIGFFYIQSICNYYSGDALETLIKEVVEAYPPHSIQVEGETQFKNQNAYHVLIHFQHIGELNLVYILNFYHKGCYYDLNLTFKNSNKEDTLNVMEEIETKYFKLK